MDRVQSASLAFFRQKWPFSKPAWQDLIFTDFKEFWYDVFWDQYQYFKHGNSI
jgi:hypothetical protein